MSWDGRSAGDVWLRCFDCTPPRSFREPDYRRHVAKDHRERPEPDAMTIPEVAKALGTDRRRALWLASTGKLRCFQIPPDRRRWVRRADLKSYVRGEMETHPEKAAKWAATGVLT